MHILSLLALASMFLYLWLHICGTLLLLLLIISTRMRAWWETCKSRTPKHERFIYDKHLHLIIRLWNFFWICFAWPRVVQGNMICKYNLLCYYVISSKIFLQVFAHGGVWLNVWLCVPQVLDSSVCVARSWYSPGLKPVLPNNNFFMCGN